MFLNMRVEDRLRLLGEESKSNIQAKIDNQMQDPSKNQAIV